MGMLLRPLDGILGSQSKVALLRVLLDSATPLSAREAARLAGLAHSGALRALRALVELGAVRRTETPGQHLYVVNRDNFLVEHALAVLFSNERARVGEVFRSITAALQPFLADNCVRSAVVYGSAARGDDGPGSDLDLLVVTRSDKDVGNVHSHLVQVAAPVLSDRFGLDLSPVVISVEQLVRQADGNDPLVGAVLREGRQIAGASIDRLLELQRTRTGGG
jgi:predicted nucleotidyltransferase